MFPVEQMSNRASSQLYPGLQRSVHRGNDFSGFSRQMFDHAPAGWIVTSPSCIVIHANHAAEVLLLQSASAMRDKPFSFHIALSDRVIFAQMSKDMLTTAFDTSRPLCMKVRTGETVDVVFRAKMLATALGVPEFISWVFLESFTGASPDFL